jgi:hypothetical protein
MASWCCGRRPGRHRLSGDFSTQHVRQLYGALTEQRLRSEDRVQQAMQASDGNLWIANPPGESVYSITTGGALLQTVSFSSQPNAYAHPQLLSGIQRHPVWNDGRTKSCVL